MLKINFLMVLMGLFLLTVTIKAQQISGPPPTRSMPDDLPMQSILYELDQMVTKRPLSSQEMTEWISSKGLVSRDNGRINVEIINKIGESSLPTEIVARFKGEIGTIWRNRVSIWVMPNQLIRLAQALPSGFYMEKANIPMPDDQGPGVTGSDDYRDNGADGSGINVGIIDGGYTSLTAAIDAGNAPATFTQVNYTGDTFRSGGTHGTQCVENVFDHAPGATYFIYKIGNLTDLGSAVLHAVSNNVDVLSHSLSWYITGWEDGTGGACVAAQTAASSGILFFTSAGNRAQQHWKGNFRDSDNNNWHNFSTGDETIGISIPNNGECNFYLSWNTAGDTYDYDFYLYDDAVTNILASSINVGNNYESFSYTNSTGSAQTVHLAVFRNSGATTELEIFTHGAVTWQQHTISTSSTTSPSNSTSGNVISVAAVHHSNFGSLSGTSGIIMNYSSRGPTNSGNQSPEITGPTNTTITGGGTFTGTSCATPNVAGVAAAFWSSATFLSASGLRYLLLQKAQIFRDWGIASTDYTYGYGGVQLHTYSNNTVWVDRNANNINGYSTFPYFYISDAQDAVTVPGRIVFVEDNYPESIILNKGRVTYEAIGSGAVLGQ